MHKIQSLQIILTFVLTLLSITYIILQIVKIKYEIQKIKLETKEKGKGKTSAHKSKK